MDEQFFLLHFKVDRKLGTFQYLPVIFSQALNFFLFSVCANLIADTVIAKLSEKQANKKLNVAFKSRWRCFMVTKLNHQFLSTAE